MPNDADSSASIVDLSRYSHRRSWLYLAKRLAWHCMQVPFWNGMPKRMSFLRVALLRLFGATIGKRCLVCAGVRVWEPWNLVMGDYSVLGTGAEIYNLAQITIGSNAVVSQESFLCTSSHDYSDPALRLFSLPITIHDGVWIAARVFIGPGVSIARGAVIGAGAVVVRDMPSMTVCAGNPCRPIKPRIMRAANPGLRD